MNGGSSNDDNDDEVNPTSAYSTPNSNPKHPNEKQWIRGVNLGGWLMAERFLTPYLFAVNSCHLQGDMCWYPGQVLGVSGAETRHGSSTTGTLDDPYAKYNISNICQPSVCHPIRPILQSHDGNTDYHPLGANKPFYDYPVDEYTLGHVFAHNRTLGQIYMERHWDTFVTKADLQQLALAGVTHMRVPMSFWMLGNIDVKAGEPWIPGAWPYFVRMCGWARQYGLQVWADLHGAPGSENGFDNSGQYTGGADGGSTCMGWSDHPQNVERTISILTELVTAMAQEGLQDVVTGFGLLNEPFFDCNEGVLRDYYNRGLQIVRRILGPETAVFVGDMFDAGKFNNGFWTDEVEHYNTYLDSHPYHVFFEQGTLNVLWFWLGGVSQQPVPLSSVFAHTPLPLYLRFQPRPRVYSSSAHCLCVPVRCTRGTIMLF
jgi:glucan 1,3-beta-glucosidase